MRDRILQLFEARVIAPQERLKKIELSDEQFYKVLASAPGDINIILARTVSLLTGDEPDKSKRELTNDILDALDRSQAARMFVGIGLKDDYHLFRGFPVRKGEKFDILPDQGTNIELDPHVEFQSWTTQASEAREIATVYDPAKGEPIGGLLVDTHINETSLYHDVNAVLRACRIKLRAISKYNVHAAQGKAISKDNVDMLAETSAYYGIYEVLTHPGIVHVRVMDKWTWSTGEGGRTPRWQTTIDQENKVERHVTATS
jgi:hypothetical protein